MTANTVFVEKDSQILLENIILGHPLMNCKVVYSDGRDEEIADVYHDSRGYIIINHKSNLGQYSRSYYYPHELVGDEPKFQILVPEGTQLWHFARA